MNIYKKIIEKFPPNIVYSFAYGSAVKPQFGQNHGKMLDLIFCVENPTEWHKNNMLKHNDHYSGLKYFSNNCISSYQQNYGARIYYNTLVDLTELNLQIKYGIISVNNLIEDLTDWDHLYISGRLHKPVTTITEPDEKITEALRKNLMSAMRTSLLVLPEKFTDYELFLTISNLSYKGDFRMLFGENKKKVHNIVKAQLDQFYELYLPIINAFSSSLSRMSDEASNKIFVQDKSFSTTLKHLSNLPSNLLKGILKEMAQNGTTEEKLINMCKEQKCSLIVNKCVNNIVWRSSISQSIKNIPTAGISKSIKYSWRKILKSFA